ncbi:hypothetical protein [Streptomyces showdoensis]|uniref:Uncharacterized protein n=1 Tax=Streptomyces showdoensis TaxID=68268 RepID=A0A2P2GQI5_STREW|nr:hypothetical protein [Streptomyces showdoensis]KKZ73751.1 hypothetical protein VO63_11655 [Streptomyces showdoensis]
MELSVGRRVRLAADLVWNGTVAPAGEPPAEAGFGGASLALAAGVEGTVERVVEHGREPSPEAEEFLRLKALHDSYGHQMPPASRIRLEEQVGALEPAWIAYEGQKVRVTARVRLDNGFVLDDAPEEFFAV